MAKDLFPSYVKEVRERLEQLGISVTTDDIRTQFNADASIDEAVTKIASNSNDSDLEVEIEKDEDDFDIEDE